VISGASSSLVERGERLGADERKALAASIFEQSQQMGGLVGNVLEMTRLEAGAIALNRDWHSMSEIAGSVMRRLQDQLESHPVEVDLPMELPLVRVDAALIEQVLAQPARERRQAHAARNTHHAARRQTGRQPAGFRRGHWARIAGGGSRAAVRQVSSRQYRGHRRRRRAGLAICRAIRAPARRPHLG